MNVLHLSTFYPPYHFGGDAMYIYRLSHAMGDAGHHVEVIHCVDSFHLLHPQRPPISFAEHPNVLRHELRSPAGSLSPFLTHQTGRPFLKQKQIVEVLNSRTWDVIHFHNMSLLGPTAFTLRPQSGNPVTLCTTHEHWLICPTHVLWKFDKYPCESPDCLRCILKHHRPPQFWRYTGLLDRCVRDIDAFVSPSRFTARMHAERGFSRKLGVLPYFIPTADRDWQEPAPRPHPRPYFLFVGRLEKIKGLQVVIDAWAKFPEYDLLVAGAGTFEQELRAQAASNPRIIFLGPKSQKELSALYYHAIAVIVPSITYETFGMTIIEAYARKTPVIAHDLGALPEVVEEGSGGIIYRTTDELLAAAHLLASDSEKRKNMGESGYQTFLERWTPAAHLCMYNKLIEECRKRRDS